MARMPLLNENDPTVTAEARAALEGARGSRGRLVNLYRAMANNPAALRGFTALGAAVYGRDTSLTRQQAELAYTTATVVNQCYY